MTEIFRHLRPQWYDVKAGVTSFKKNGGISFLLHPKGAGRYDYWLYICPLDAPFSARTAKHNLRERVERGVMPWGEITLTEDLLVDQLVKSVLAEENLVSETSHLALDIMITIWAAKYRREKATNGIAAAAAYKGL